MSSADRFGWLARLPWMDDDICDNPVQEGRLWLGYDYRAELNHVFSPIGAGLDTKPVKRLPSRDAPELRHQMVATPTGHLRRQRIAVGSFFRMWTLGVATHDGSDPSPRSPAPLGAIAMVHSRERSWSRRMGAFAVSGKLTLVCLLWRLEHDLLQAIATCDDDHKADFAILLH